MVAVARSSTAPPRTSLHVVSLILVTVLLDVVSQGLGGSVSQTAAAPVGILVGTSVRADPSQSKINASPKSMPPLCK